MAQNRSEALGTACEYWICTELLVNIGFVHGPKRFQVDPDYMEP